MTEELKREAQQWSDQELNDLLAGSDEDPDEEEEPDEWWWLPGCEP